MNREQLQTLLLVASRVASDPDVLVLGSQAILGSYPEDRLPPAATASMEADVAFLDDPDRAKADLVDAVIGEFTEFHQAHGYYAEGIHTETAVLPSGWRDRLVSWRAGSDASGPHFVEPHDLALSKLAAGRPKDHAFVAALRDAGLLTASVLQARLELMPDSLAPVARDRLEHAVARLIDQEPRDSASSIERIRILAATAEAADGNAPLDEATWLALRRRDGRRWVRDGGFALLVEDELSLVVDPDARGRGLGTDLLSVALVEAPSPLSAWSHADHPAARVLADRNGFERVRELWVMRRSMNERLPDVPTLDGVTIRGYRPSDEAELLRVNGAAFAAHPEQGGMDETNLAERMAEPWFDPAGLLVAEREGRMVGFHWTKQHSDALGEVYVVGIDPAAQGGGLGKALTLAGLHHLASQGVDEVLLYVESDNAPAIAVYAGLGFTHADHDTHVMYRRG